MPEQTASSKASDQAGYGQTRLFVYGTLKKDHPNHALLASKEVQFLGRDSICGPFVMVSLGGFPGVCQSDSRIKGANRIFGELYAVDEGTLASCDLLEGHPNWFERFKYRTDLSDQKAWVYTLPWRWVEQNMPMAGGVWRPNVSETAFWNHQGVELRG